MKPIDHLRALLALPDAPTEDDIGRFPPDGDGTLPLYFDPWELFPCLYGSYSSDFDEVAITVLGNILHRRLDKAETTAHRMFREMLCTAELCDYGTSPRACFPDDSFEELLPALIERWKAYYAVQWGKPFADGE